MSEMTLTYGLDTGLGIDHAENLMTKKMRNDEKQQSAGYFSSSKVMKN